MRKVILTTIGIMFFLSCGLREDKPNVILIIIDTLRADHLGCYGYERDTSPFIDSLAGTGTLWLNAQAQSSWTLPGVSSIFTGLTVRSHGADKVDGYVYGLDPEIPLITTLLKSEGYQTGGLFNVYLLSEQFGFHRGFDAYNCNYLGDGEADTTIDMVLEWLNLIDTNRPFFATVHLFDVHDPYDPPFPFDELYTESGTAGDSLWQISPEGMLIDPGQKNHLMALYDGEINRVDFQLERLFSYLRTRGLAENTIIVFTSDHGEEFLDHGWIGHGATLFNEVLHIPLIITGTGISAGVTEDVNVGQYDILPTVLSLLGIDIPDGLDGMDILSGNVPVLRPVPASGLNTDDPPLASVLIDSMKVIWNSELDRALVFSHNTDRGEHHGVPADSLLLEKVLFYWATPCIWNPPMIDQSTITPILRDLGYL